MLKKEYASDSTKKNYLLGQNEYTLLTMVLKTDFWRQEAEWRISVPLICGDGIDYDSIPKDSNVVIPQKVTSSIGSNGRFPLCINFYVSFEPEIIENIMLAPDCKVAPEDIKKMLHIYGFDFLIDKVLLSNGSLR